MDKKAIIILGWCRCYIVSLGVKGNSGDPGSDGDPGTRGPRGLTGKTIIIQVISYTYIWYCIEQKFDKWSLHAWNFDKQTFDGFIVGSI